MAKQELFLQTKSARASPIYGIVDNEDHPVMDDISALVTHIDNSSINANRKRRLKHFLRLAVDDMGLEKNVSVVDYRVVRASPKSGGVEYISLIFENSSRTTTDYLWNDDLSNYDPQVTSHDPSVETRWVAR